MCCKVQHAPKFTAAKSPHAFFAQHDPTGSPQFPHGYQHLVFPNDFPPQFIVADGQDSCVFASGLSYNSCKKSLQRRDAMPKTRSPSVLGSGRILYLPTARIRPNPMQPRKHFDTGGLQELAGSIRQYGVLQPLTVRKAGGAYELVAGERRLRAARLAGLTEVPCLLADVDEEASGMLALVENLQRRDLDYIEEAEGLQKLMQQYHLSQEQAARRIGKSQSAVANKLRILRHPPSVLQALRENHLTERSRRTVQYMAEYHKFHGTLWKEP